MQTKKPAITSKLVLQWQQSNSETAKLEDEIINRIDYILHVWFAAFNTKLEYWYFEGANEGEVGSINIDSDTIWGFHIKVNNYPDDMSIIDKNGMEYSWQSEIPVRWLYDDSFEEEIIKGKKEYEQKSQERAAKRKQKADLKKIKNEKLIEQAKSKLSKEELAALKNS